MTDVFKHKAYSGDALPDGLDWKDSTDFIAYRYLSRAAKRGLICGDDAASEYADVSKRLDDADKMRTHYIALMETMHSILMQTKKYCDEYKERPSRMCADALVLTLQGDIGAIALHVERGKDERFHCPMCEAFISDEHAARKPKFCEWCGQLLDWGETTGHG